jgi:hypothetical protein
MDSIIKVSTPGVDVNKAKTNQLLLSSQYPFAKLDTQKAISFQTIYLFFNNDPPEPSAGNTTTTTVYSFAHGYNYTPQVWGLFYVVSGAPLTNFYQTYFQDYGIIAAQNPISMAYMYVTADATNVYVKVDKYYDGSNPNNLASSSYKITIFTFVDDLSGV